MATEEVNGPLFLVIGYGLATVLYGGYWLYLRNKTSKLNGVLNSMKSR
jgi:hypothetical protein